MKLLLFIIVLNSILLALAFILREVSLGKYKLKNENSIVKQESIKAFEKEFPNKNVEDLKLEIEKISDMLLDNQESNRYTKKLQEKAKNDGKLDEIRNSIVDDVEIIDYKSGKLKAQVNYSFKKEEYTLIMYLNIVKKGRAFLKNYRVLKRHLA